MLNDMLPVTTTILKAQEWPLILIYILTGFPLLVGILLDVDNPDNNLIFFTVGVHLLITFFWFLIRKTKVFLYPDSIVYKTLFKERSMSWNNIIKSSVSLELNIYSGEILWLFISAEKKLIFKPAYFSKKNNQQIAKMLINKCPDIKISNEIMEMANGKFPWYFFK